jgi:hypothetical protein
MDIYSKIDKMFQKDISDEILNEIKELKNYVKQSTQKTNTTKTQIKKPKNSQIKTEKKKKELPKEYYNFVNNFKQKYRAKPRYNFYVEFEYKNRILSLNEKGLLCEKGEVLAGYKALEVFEYLYNHRFEIIEEKEEIFK